MSRAARALLYGPGGSGKSVTAILLAIGRSHARGKAPIAFVDPEHVEEFLRPITDAEGIDLLVEPSSTFADMIAAREAAEAAGCCAFVVDHYDQMHRELTDAQKAKTNHQGRKLPYHHREELIRVWDAWVSTFRTSPLDYFFTARRGWDYGDTEDENGDASFVKLGTKARGDADAMYEPDLLIEMERIDKFTRDKLSKRKQGEIVHIARVLKDRRMTLNGRSFEWKDLNAYTVGAYKAVYDKFSPHFSPVANERRLLRPEGVQRSSESFFTAPAGESAFTERMRRVTVAVEEIQAALNTIWPGQTSDEKRLRNIVMETLFKSRSWTAIEAMSPEVLEQAWRSIQAFETAASDEDQQINVKDAAQVIALIASCLEMERSATGAMVL